MVQVYKASFLLTKHDLVLAATLKLETTNNHYSDIFTITAKAFGGDVKKPKRAIGRAKKKLPKASFDQMASFIGAM